MTWKISYGPNTIQVDGNAYVAVRTAARYFTLKDFARNSPVSNDGKHCLVLTVMDGNGFKEDVSVAVPYEVNIVISGEPEIDNPEALAATVGLTNS
jgi:hypothetical protein